MQRDLSYFGDRVINHNTRKLDPRLEAPHPVLFNPWKHHAGVLRMRIADAVTDGPTALAALARELVVIGTELMDLYLGMLMPCEIGAGVLAQLQVENRATPDAYRDWIAGNRGYRVLTLPTDGSVWVLRMGEEGGHWIHVHPARWAPRTCRVKANVLKTAVMAIACAGVRGIDPLDLVHVNEVRRDYLGLAPLGRDLAGDQGIGQTIRLLLNTEGA